MIYNPAFICHRAFYMSEADTLPDPVVAFSDSFRLYWHGLVFVIAIFTALAVFRSLLRSRDDPRSEKTADSVVVESGLICLPLGLIFARILYCIFTPDAGGLFELSGGGYALYGGVAGVLLGLFITSIISRVPFVELLDAASPSGAIAIAIGRLAAYFSHEELGYIVNKEKWQFFPVSVFIENESCWRMCVFSFEALAAAIAFAATLILFNAVYSGSRPQAKHGDVFILFTLIYSSSQTLLESWRTDTMTLRNNAFVRISQVLSAVFLAAALVVVFVRACKANKKTVITKDVVLWVAAAGLLAVAFVMEFGKNKETMTRNNWFMFFTLFPLSVIGIAALLGAFRFTPQAQSQRASYPVGKKSAVRSTYRDDADQFDDDDEW